MKTTVDDLSLIRFQQFSEDGTLTVFASETGRIPFEIARVFTISGVSIGSWRANHAHRFCTQLHACLSGKVKIVIADGERSRESELHPDGAALLVPPLLWEKVQFDGPDTVLAVFCDKPYDPQDYIHDWQEFIDAKGKS